MAVNGANTTASAINVPDTTEVPLLPTISKKSILSNRKKSWFFLLGKKSVSFAEMDSRTKNGGGTKTHERWKMYVAEQFKTLHRSRETRDRWLGRAGRKSRKRRGLNNSPTSSSSSRGAAGFSGDTGLAHSDSSDLLESFEIPEPDHKKRKKGQPKRKRKKRGAQTNRNQNKKGDYACQSANSGVDDSGAPDKARPEETDRNLRLKRPTNAYLIFSRACRLELKDLMLPTLENRLVTTVLGHIWRYLSKEERHCFYEEAELERNRYYEQKKSQQQAGLKEIPKKPMNAFMLFCQEQRPGLHPQTMALSGRQAVRRIAKKWNKLSPRQKQVYREKAASERALCETNTQSSNEQESQAPVKEENTSGACDLTATASLGALLLKRKMGKNNNKWFTDSSEDSATLIKSQLVASDDPGSSSQRVACVCPSRPATAFTRSALASSATARSNQQKVLATVTQVCSSESDSEGQSQPSTSRRQETVDCARAALSSRDARCRSSASSLIASDVSGDSEGGGSEARRRRRRRRRRKRKKRKRSRVRRKEQKDEDEDEEGGGTGGVGGVPLSARSVSKQVRWKDEFFPWDTCQPVSSVLRDDADMCTRLSCASRHPSAPVGTAVANKRNGRFSFDHHRQQQQLAGSRDDSWLTASSSSCVYDPASATVAVSQRSSSSDLGLKSSESRDDSLSLASSTSTHGFKLPSSPDSRDSVVCRYSASSSDRYLLAHSRIHRKNSWLVPSASSQGYPLPSAPAITVCRSSSDLCHLCGKSSSCIHRVSSPAAAGRASGRAQVEAVFLKPSVELSLCSSSASSSNCPYTLPDVVCSSSSNDESACGSHRLSNFHISSHQGSASSVATSSATSLGYCCRRSQRQCEANSSYSARPAHSLIPSHSERIGNVESDISPSAPLSGDLKDAGTNRPKGCSDNTFCPPLSCQDGIDSCDKPSQLFVPVSEMHDEKKESAAGAGNSKPSMKPKDTCPKNDTKRLRSSGEVCGVRKVKTRSAEDICKDDCSRSVHSSRAGLLHHEDVSAKATSDSVLNRCVNAAEQTGCGNSRGGIRETRSDPVSMDFALLSGSREKDSQPSGALIRHTSQEAIAQLVQRIKREEDLDKCLIPRAVSLEKKSSQSFRPNCTLTPDYTSKALDSFTFSECHENSSLPSAVGSTSMKSADEFVDLYGPDDEYGDGHSTNSSAISRELSGVSDKTRSMSEDLKADKRKDQRRRLKRKCSYDSLEVVNSSNNFSVSTAPGCSSLKYAFDLDRSCSRGVSFPSDSASDLGKLCSRSPECAFDPNKSCSLGISCSRAFDLDKSCGRREPLSKTRPESGFGNDLINFQLAKHPRSLHDLPILSDLEVEFCQRKGWIH